MGLGWAFEARCPYQLPIREMLVEQVAFYDSLVP
jgi:hypothetical protein